MPRIIIIGAGITGISAAYHLEKKGFFDYTLFEKESIPGGLCRTIKQDGFTFDYTGHLLHLSDDYCYELIKQIVGFDSFNTIERKSFIYSHNVYTNYPFQMNLFGLPIDVITECIEQFVLRKKTRKKPNNYIEWVYQNFGKGFAKHFFFPYQKKIFAYDLRKINANWTGRFVPATSLQNIIEGALTNNSKQVGYNARFFYPKQGGIMAWVHTFAQQLKNKIKTNHCVKTVDIKNKLVTFTNGYTQRFDMLINTMPLDTLLKTIKEKSSTQLQSAIPKLKCNSVVNFNLGVNRPDLSDKHWIYYPEKKYPFYRIGFPSNFTAHAAPKNCSSLYGEFAHVNKSKQWVAETLKSSWQKTKEVLNVADSQILTQKVLYIKHAYVIYDHWREKNLFKLHEQLHKQTIFSTGRYGSWKYSSMQEAILDGKEVADTVLIMPARRLHSIKNLPKKDTNNEINKTIVSPAEPYHDAK